MTRPYRTLLAALPVLALVLSQPVHAANPKTKLTLEQEFAYERLAVLSGDTGSEEETSGIEWRLRSETTANYERRFENDSMLLVSPSLKVTGYWDERQVDRIEFDTRAEYRFIIDPWSKLQLRPQVQLSYSHDSGRTVYSRSRAGLHLRYRHRPENQTYGRIRVGYRDQNEETFEGFDQSEMLLEFGHDWRPRNDRMMISGVIYHNTVDAEDESFSSTELGFRASIRYPVSDELEVTGRLSAYDRQYNDIFSTEDPVDRHDRRVQLGVSADYKFSDRMTAFAFAGFDVNNSNIAERDYGGPVIGIGVRFSFQPDFAGR